MDWTTAWEIAGEICDLVGNITVQQQEQIANILQKHDNQKFDHINQKWVVKQREAYGLDKALQEAHERNQDKTA